MIRSLGNRSFNPFKVARLRDLVARERDAWTIVEAIRPHVFHRTVALHDSKFQGPSVTNAIAHLGLVKETPRVVFSTHY